MALQLVWSFCLMFVDICSLWKNLDLHRPDAVWPIVIGDWVSVPLPSFYCLATTLFDFKSIRLKVEFMLYSDWKKKLYSRIQVYNCSMEKYRNTLILMNYYYLHQ